MSAIIEFNASITVTELLTKTLENCAKDLAIRCINNCASRHGFDAQEEIRILGLENLTLIKKQMTKKAKAPKAQKEKKVKKSSFPLPFIAELVDNKGCHGLAYNRGLFTQCSKKIMENGQFCKSCQTEADKNASGNPDCGTIEQRLSTGLYEFKDSKGRSPVSYKKILDKLNLGVEASCVEALAFNAEIDSEHFRVVEKQKVKKSSEGKAIRGRPKKQTAAIEAENVTDLFAKLTAENEEEAIPEVDEKPKKAKLTEEEKAIKKAALEAERAAKKVEREKQVAIEKAEREEKRKADIEQKKLEKEQKIAAEKAEREAKRLQEKAEKEQKKAEEKAAKEAAKASKSVKKSVHTEAKVVAPTVEPVLKKVGVSRIVIEGQTYLKSNSGTNILYDPSTKEEVGIWDPETKTIKELPDEEDEEKEDEYDEDDLV